MRFLNSVFFHKLVVPSPPDSHPKIFSSSVAISLSYWPFKKICVYKKQRFLVLLVLKHGDWKIWTVLTYKTSVFKPEIKFCVKKFKIPILKSLGIEERKLNLLRKNFNSMPFHTLVIDFLKFFFLKNQIFFLNLRVLYMKIFTLKAYNSAKKQQMTEIF